MSSGLTLLHTAEVHIDTFNRLGAEIAPGLELHHVVEPNLLAIARARGLTAALAEQVQAVLVAARRHGAKVVLCTCSTIGGLAEAAAQSAGCLVLRVDRPMAEAAVALGGRILVVAALASTLQPTRQLLESVARAADVAPEFSEAVCDGAWKLFERGDLSGYLAVVESHVRARAMGADVIVLAQGSMAAVAESCADLGIPVFSSPRLGLEVAIRLLGRPIA